MVIHRQLNRNEEARGNDFSIHRDIEQGKRHRPANRAGCRERRHVVAARKHFRTDGDLLRIWTTTGAIQIYGVRKVVETVEDPDKEMTLEAARKINPAAEIGVGSPHSEARPTLWDASRPRPPSKSSFRRFARPSGRRFIPSIPGAWANWSTARSSAWKARTWLSIWARPKRGCRRKNSRKLESFSVGDRVRCVIKSVEKAGKNAGRDRFARRAGAGDAPVRAGSARDLRQHRGHQRLRARSRRAHQDRRAEPRSRCG